MITVGSRLGGYTVLRLLGQGGMGQVYLAQHNRIARRVGVKVLLPELSSNQSVIERFFTEAQATSLIRHPGIVEVLDCDVLDGQAFIVMEYLEGESLAGYLARLGDTLGDVPFALAVVAQVAIAVGAAHGAGIIHRDLKPDNVFLCANPRNARVAPKVLDFGIAKVALLGAIAHTRTGAVIGTPTYMSPEQCRGGSKAVDGRSDVYSLGCIFYEMLTGRPPFVREGMGEMIVAHISEPPEDPRNLVLSMPALAASIVMRMLAKSPDDRPATMDAVASELAQCLEALGVRRPMAEIEPRRRVIWPAEDGPVLAGALTPGALTPGVLTPAVLTPGVLTPAVLTPAVLTPAAAVTPSVTPSPPPLAGGTRVLRREASLSTPGPTTFRGAAGESTIPPDDFPLSPASSRRWLLPAIIGAAVIGALVLVLALRPSGRTAIATATAAPPASAAAPAVVPPPTVAAVAAAAAAPAPAAAPDTVSVELRGLPAQAEVTLDGVLAPRLPLTLKRADKKHAVVVRARGYRDETLEVAADRDRVLDLSMVAATPTPEKRRPPSKSPGQKGSKSNYDDM